MTDHQRHTLCRTAAVIVGVCAAVTAAYGQTPCQATLYPCETGGGYEITVAADGSGDFRDLPSALRRLDENVRTIRLEPGVYRLDALDLYASGTPASPLALVAADSRRRPVLDFGAVGASDGGRNRGVNVEGNWWLLDGLHVRDTENGVFVIGRHVTVRNSVVEDTGREGIILAQKSSGFLRVERNEVRRIGLRPEPDMPQGRHGVYVGNQGDIRTEQVHVVDNVFRDLSGAGVHMNGSKAADTFRRATAPKRAGGTAVMNGGIHGVVVENNVVIDARSGINLYRYVFGAQVRHNTILFTDANLLGRRSGQMLQVRNAAGNEVSENLFYSTLPTRNAIVGYRETEADPGNETNRLRDNVWCLDDRAGLSWNRPGSGVDVDTPMRSYRRKTGDDTSVVGTRTDGSVCTLLARALTPSMTEAEIRQLPERMPALRGIGARPLR